MAFEDSFKPDQNGHQRETDVSSLGQLESMAPGISDFCRLYAGRTFNQGVYRIHAVSEMPHYTKSVVEMFSQFAGRVHVFAADWLGRQIAVDLKPRTEGRHELLMLDPSIGEAFEIPCGFQDFHHDDLVNYQKEAIAVDYFKEWLSTGGQQPGLRECVGYRKPLFLGGKDELANLEISDLEVYWSISAQILIQIRDLPEGTPINKIDIQD